MSSTETIVTEAEVSNATFNTRELAVLHTSMSERERTPKYSNTSAQIGNVSIAHEIKFSAEAEESASTAQESSRIPRAPPGTSSKSSIQSDVFDERKQIRILTFLRYKLQSNLQKSQQPDAEKMEALSRYLLMLEHLKNPSRTAMVQVKIQKVVKFISKHDGIPEDDSFGIQARAAALLEKWKLILTRPETDTATPLQTHEEEKEMRPAIESERASVIIDLTETTDSELEASVCGTENLETSSNSQLHAPSNTMACKRRRPSLTNNTIKASARQGRKPKIDDHQKLMAKFERQQTKATDLGADRVIILQQFREASDKELELTTRRQTAMDKIIEEYAEGMDWVLNRKAELERSLEDNARGMETVRMAERKIMDEWRGSRESGTVRSE